LAIEALEARQVLDAAAPWHNDELPLDVNHDGLVAPVDAMAVINRLLLVGLGQLPAPSGTPNFYYDVNGDNMASPNDAMRVINRLLTPPTITLDTIMPFTIDLTPRLKVFAASPAGLPDGTPIHVDVDLNNDGQYAGDEMNYMVSSLHEGRSEFALSPGLAPNGPSGPYPIALRARLVDPDGLPATSANQPMVVDTQTSDALYNYVNTFDPSYTWSLVSTTAGPDYTFYVLQMTSQTWRSGFVNDPVWDHWLKVVVPTGPITDTSLLLITGGNNASGPPGLNLNNLEDQAVIAVAQITRSVTVNLRVVPNEPVSFFAETPPRSRTEDEIIAYTFDQWLRGVGEPDNDTWPLLLPMAKSAVRAMDTIQAFVPGVSGNQFISDFIVSGYSKRGWTTWLTAAADSRVRAIIPGVIDVLNIAPQLGHHYGVYGFFSEQIQDYNDLEIFHRLRTPESQLLSRIIDPYRYLNNGRFQIPKLLLNGAGDEFFVSDSSQFYFDDLPGEDNYLRYFPNAGHGLDATAVVSTVTFMDAILNNRHLPDFSWTVEPDGSIHVHVDDQPSKVLLWQATNPNARDFRHGYHPDIIWTSNELSEVAPDEYVGSVPTPPTGATAFLIELTFPSAIPGFPYIFTTDIRVESNLPLAPWPFSDGSAQQLVVPAAAPVAAPASAATSSTTSMEDRQQSVALFSVPSPGQGASAVATPLADPAPPADLPAGAAVATALADAADHAEDETDELALSGALATDAADSVFAGELDDVLE
jgi:PhoPQ-activated pathogenicity-related protein